MNRVVLASDGVANVGLTDAESILRRIRDDAETGIQLVTVGFGMGYFNDTLLEQLADEGDGFYAYVDTLDAVRLNGDAGGHDRIRTVHPRWVDPESSRSDGIAHEVRFSDLARSLRATAPTFQLDLLVAGAAEWLRTGEAARHDELEDVAELADELADRLPVTDEVHEFLELLDTAARIAR